MRGDLFFLTRPESPLYSLRSGLEQMHFPVEIGSPESIGKREPRGGIIADLVSFPSLTLGSLRQLSPGVPILLIEERERGPVDPLTLSAAPDRFRSEFLEILAHFSEARALADRLHRAVEGIDGESEQIGSLKQQLIPIARSAAPLLVCGERGSGKERIAQAAGTLRYPWVVFDCTAYTPDKMELELYGCIRGQMAGATADRTGAIAEAKGGSLLIDSPELLPLNLQAKIFRTMESGEFRPIGASRSQKTSLRWLAATGADLRQAIARGEFRQDLFSLFSTHTLRTIPLRHRRSDIPILARELLRIHSRHLDPPPRWSEEAIASLSDHPLPGNLSQLSGIARRAAALHPFGTIPLSIARTVAEESALPKEGGEPIAANYLALQQWLRDQERGWLLSQLAKENGSVSRTALRIGIGRTALHQKIKALGIDHASLRKSAAAEPTSGSEKRRSHVTR